MILGNEARPRERPLIWNGSNLPWAAFPQWWTPLLLQAAAYSPQRCPYSSLT
jgi:hypothetical protein